MVNSSHKRIKRTIVNYLQGMVFSKQRVLRDIGGFCHRSKTVGQLKKRDKKRKKKKSVSHCKYTSYLLFGM